MRSGDERKRGFCDIGTKYIWARARCEDEGIGLVMNLSNNLK